MEDGPRRAVRVFHGLSSHERGTCLRTPLGQAGALGDYLPDSATAREIDVVVRVQDLERIELCNIEFVRVLGNA